MRSCNQLVAELLSDQVSTQSPSQNALTLERNGTTNGMFGFPVVVQSCLTLCSPMNCSTLGFPIIHYLPEFAQTRVHWVNDTIQPSHPLPPLSPPALHLSQHQGLFQWYPVLINKIFPIHLCSMGWSLDLLRPFRKKNCICTHRPFAKGIRVMKNLWQMDTSKLQRVYLKKTLNRV